jgi:eukaryotic-like serine/threonine-protein kinase
MGLLYVVEDSPAQRELLRAALAPLGHEVRTFADGQAARAAIKEAAPDLLVADIVLPGLSGLELCQEVRERHRRLDLPVLLVSSLDQVEDLARGYEAGADEYLLKPVDAAKLRRKAQLLLDRRARRQGTAAQWTRYELLGTLGKGQTATIWRARRKEDGLVVALKVLPAAAGREAAARLLAEAELLRALDECPGVVGIRDVGSDGGATYYAMDLVPGETLRARLDRLGRLPVREAAGVGRALAQGLAGLARRGIVHGDVKPSNVVLGQGEPGGRAGAPGVTLIDFGLAFRVGDPAPPGGGTLTHLAPEVVRGAPASPRSDVYALGVTLCEALSGALPHTASGADLAALKVEGREPDLGPLLDLDLPPGLVAAVEEAVAPDPAVRTRDADDLARALLPYCS